MPRKVMEQKKSFADTYTKLNKNFWQLSSVIVHKTHFTQKRETNIAPKTKKDSSHMCHLLVKEKNFYTYRSYLHRTIQQCRCENAIIYSLSKSQKHFLQHCVYGSFWRSYTRSRHQHRCFYCLCRLLVLKQSVFFFFSGAKNMLLCRLLKAFWNHDKCTRQVGIE